MLSECIATLELVDIIDARTQSDLVGNILKHLNCFFDALPLRERRPPSFSPEPDGTPDNGSLPDAYYL